MGREKIIIHDRENSTEAKLLFKNLAAHNNREYGKSHRRELTVALKDDGKMIAALNGSTSWSWFYIRMLWVSETHRSTGIGARLMAAAEKEAVARGCVSVWVDTFSARAADFYRRQGYSIFGKLKEFPPGHTRFFLQKKIK